MVVYSSRVEFRKKTKQKQMSESAVLDGRQIGRININDTS